MNAPSTLLMLDASGAVPLHRRLYDAVRNAILSGRLQRGARLPASRQLASELGLSRATVSTALDQLRAEGYVEGRERAGTFVAGAFPEERLHAPKSQRARIVNVPAPGRLSARGATLAACVVSSASTNPGRVSTFRTGLPAIDAFPRALWARLTTRRWRRLDARLLGYAQSMGYMPLRKAIAEYASSSRAARCVAEQVIITSGSQQGLDLAARLLLDVGDEAWIENPGYRGARSVLEGAGARLVPVPVDREGMDVAAGRAAAPRARLAYVTPSHQYPLGATMSIARRIDLLRWARESHGWILEDDYDSEFRYTSRPLPCLQGLDEHGRVIYVGTFSKTLFPGLRLGYVIAPESLVDAFATALAVGSRHAPSIDQAVLAEFMSEGHYLRHLRRMRGLYAERQDILLKAALSELDEEMEVASSDAGMHLIGWLRRHTDDAHVATSILAHGIESTALSPLHLGPSSRPALLLGYSAFPPSALRRGARELGVALRALDVRHRRR